MSFARLQEARLDLEQGLGCLEARFLTISSELEAMSGFGGRFVEQVEKLVGLATGKDCDHSAFSNAIGLIEQSTDFLVRCQEETGRSLELLRHYNTEIEHLLGVEVELERTILPLKFVQTLFKAESAPLGPAVQQMFQALTQEIEGLQSQVREIFGTKFKQLNETHRSIGKVIVQLDRQARTLQQVTATHKARIESSLQTLKSELSSNQERDVRLARLSKELARQVDRVVMGLQFQDIVNQKLQHVIAALPRIGDKVAQFNEAPDAFSASEALQFLRQSSQLEVGQLQAAGKELAGAEQSIQGGIQQMLAHVGEIDSQCLSLEEFKLLTTSFDGMVQVLVEMIEEVRRLVAATVAAVAEAYQMLEPLGGLASDLTAVVRSTSARINLIGLNSQVQAAQAAQDRRGAGLEVLAARTSDISRETSRISQQVAAQLDALVGGLAGIVQAFGKLRGEGLAQQTLLDGQGCVEEGRLHAFRDEALDTLQTIGSSLDAIRDQANRTLASVKFAPFCQVVLPAMSQALVAIGDLAEKCLQTSARGVSQASLVEAFKRDYTMASERKVFDGLVSSGASSTASAPVVEPASDPAIELFADTPEANTDPSTAPAEPAPQEALAAVGAPEPALVKLGDNAELF